MKRNILFTFKWPWIKIWDYDELHFINKELYFYQNCFSTANVERRVLEYNWLPNYKYYYLNEFEFDVINNGREEPTGEENYDIKSHN
jgi:hypothetical protein